MQITGSWVCVKGHFFYWHATFVSCKYALVDEAQLCAMFLFKIGIPDSNLPGAESSLALGLHNAGTMEGPNDGIFNTCLF